VFCCCREGRVVGGEEGEEAYAMRARSSCYVDRFPGPRSGENRAKPDQGPITTPYWSNLICGQVLYIEVKELQTRAYDIETLE
jgi:hypothetical protein